MAFKRSILRDFAIPAGVVTGVAVCTGAFLSATGMVADLPLLTKTALPLFAATGVVMGAVAGTVHLIMGPPDVPDLTEIMPKSYWDLQKSLTP